MTVQQQKPAYMITIVNTTPPVFVETTQAEFRAVVQRLTGNSANLYSNNNNTNSNSQKLQDHVPANINLPSSQSEGTSSTESPIIAASNRSRPRASAGVTPSNTASSEESFCHTSGDAAAGSVEITDADHDCNSYSACHAKIKLRICHSDGDTTDTAGEQQQELANIYNIIDHGVHAVLHMPEASSYFSCTPSIAAAAAATTSSSSSSLNAPSAASLISVTPHAGPGFPANDPPGAAISGSTGQLTAVSHDDDFDYDDDFPGRFYCDPESLPPLLDVMTADEQQQQLGLYCCSTGPASTIAQWEILNSSFSWKEDDFLRV